MGEVKSFRTGEIIATGPTFETPERGELRLVGGTDHAIRYLEAKGIALSIVSEIRDLAKGENGLIAPLSQHDEETQKALEVLMVELKEHLSELSDEDIAKIGAFVNGIFDEPSQPGSQNTWRDVEAMTNLDLESLPRDELIRIATVREVTYVLADKAVGRGDIEPKEFKEVERLWREASEMLTDTEAEIVESDANRILGIKNDDNPTSVA